MLVFQLACIKSCFSLQGSECHISFFKNAGNANIEIFLSASSYVTKPFYLSQLKSGLRIRWLFSLPVIFMLLFSHTLTVPLFRHWIIFYDIFHPG